MVDHGIDKDTKALETPMERGREESNRTNQIDVSDVSVTLRERQGEGDSLNGSSNDRQDDQSMDGEFDLPSTPLANVRQSNLSQSSSAVEVSSVNDLSLTPSPRMHKG